MADEGTLATSAEVLLAIGENASANQILEANTNTWIKWAEMEMSAYCDKDLVDGYSSVGTNWKRYLSVVASTRAAFHGVNQNQNTWTLATSQSKLNVFDEVWRGFKKLVDDDNSDFLVTIGINS